MKIKIYLLDGNGGWALTEATAEEQKKRGITISPTATVGNRATVGDGAKVGDRAKVGHEAKVGDGAKVGDRAKVGHGATVGDGATLTRSMVPAGPIGSRKATTWYDSEHDVVFCGCWSGPLAEFKKRVTATYKRGHKHRKEYDWAIGMFAAALRGKEEK